MSGENQKNRTPSEHKISAKWDACLENFLVNFSIGLVAGGLSSVVVARSATSRAAITAFAAGSGTGSSWAKCREIFESNKPAVVVSTDK